MLRVLEALLYCCHVYEWQSGCVSYIELGEGATGLKNSKRVGSSRAGSTFLANPAKFVITRS